MKISLLVIFRIFSSVDSFQAGGMHQISRKVSFSSAAKIRSDGAVLFEQVPDIATFSADVPAASNTKENSTNDAYAEADSIFDTIDADQDGGISNIELRAHLVLLGYSRDSIRYLFNTLDADADGVITREEMRYAFANYESTALYMALGLGNDVTNDAFDDAVNRVRSNADAAYAEADTLFDAIDTNKDGGISNNELRAHLVLVGYSRDSIRYLFNTLDANLDGVISREEMRYAFANYESTALRMALGVGNDVTNDAFDDAVAQVRSNAIGTTSSNEANDKLADLIFDIVDADENGKIDPEELRQHFNLNEDSTLEIGNFSVKLDVDVDGTVSREKMREAFNQCDPGELAKSLGLI